MAQNLWVYFSVSVVSEISWETAIKRLIQQNVCMKSHQLAWPSQGQPGKWARFPAVCEINNRTPITLRLTLPGNRVFPCFCLFASFVIFSTEKLLTDTPFEMFDLPSRDV